jgi:O-antigen ligase
MATKTTISEVFAIFLIVSLSFSPALPNIFLGLSLVFFISKIIKKEINFSITNQIITLSILFIYLTIKQLISTKFNFEDYSIFTRFLIILIIPFPLQVVSRNKIAIAIVISNFLAIVIALFNTIIYFIKHKNIPFENGEVVNKILVIDRPYLGFFSLIAIIMCFYLIKQMPKYKLGLLVISFALFVFIILIVARLSLITFFALGLIYLLFYSKFSIFKKIILVVSIISIIFVILFSYKNMTNRFFTNTSIERIKLYDPRVDIWDCAYRITQENDFNFILGCKSHQFISNKLVDCYKTKSENDLQRRQWFIDTRFNTHNQFIDFYLAGGLIALVLFLYFIFEIVKTSRNNFYFFSLVISLVLFLFFENVFQRQLGCYLIGIILTLIFFKEKKRISR